jgi:hypothetical protein
MILKELSQFSDSQYYQEQYCTDHGVEKTKYLLFSRGVLLQLVVLLLYLCKNTSYTTIDFRLSKNYCLLKIADITK